MMGLEALTAVEGIAPRAEISPVEASPIRQGAAVHAPNEMSFGALLTQGLENVENRIDNANRLVRDFALDDSVPLHEVTIALEEARLAVELASTIRARLVESFREIMNTQL